jgi:hypothetical protein
LEQADCTGRKFNCVSCRQHGRLAQADLVYLSAEPSFSHNLVTLVRVVDRAPELPLTSFLKPHCHPYLHRPYLQYPAQSSSAAAVHLIRVIFSPTRLQVFLDKLPQYLNTTTVAYTQSIVHDGRNPQVIIAR